MSRSCAMAPTKAPKLSEEQKEAAKLAKSLEKANASLVKAAKDDQLAKAEEALSKGADANFVNDKGHSVAHIAAGFGALKIIRCLYARGAKFDTLNKVCEGRAT